MSRDSIDDAIAAAAASEEQRLTIQVKLGTGRIVALNLPIDLTPLEAIEMISYVSTRMPAKLVEASQRRPSLLVPTGVRIARG